MPTKSVLARLLPALALCVSIVLLAGCPKPPIDSIKSVVTVHRVDDAALAPQSRIAIFQFAGEKGRVLSDLLAIHLLRRGIDVVDRDSMSRIVAEVHRTEAGSYNNDLSEAEVIQQIGKIIGADYVLVGETDARDPEGVTMPGKLGPRFGFARSRLTMRLFSAIDGKVLWWGTSETFVTGQVSASVRPLDYLRITALRAAEALTDARVKTNVKAASGAFISTVFTPSRSRR